jgi:hypothetical protein
MKSIYNIYKKIPDLLRVLFILQFMAIILAGYFLYAVTGGHIDQLISHLMRASRDSWNEIINSTSVVVYIILAVIILIGISVASSGVLLYQIFFSQLKSGNHG